MAKIEKTNAMILHEIWVEEVPNSKRRGFLRTFSEGLNIGEQMVRNRLAGTVYSCDYTTLMMIREFERKGICLDKWREEINKLRAKYGEFNEYGLE